MLRVLRNIPIATWISILVSLLAYFLFAYHVDRSQFGFVVSLYSILFICFLIIVQQNDIKTLTSISIVFRLILLLAIPNLSNDFYRFIWDGRLIWEGINPYLHLPVDNVGLVHEGQTLYEGMGSMNGSHYTCYPPINQLTFVIPAIFFAKNLLGSTIVMRLLIILADIGTLYYGKKILKHLGQSTHLIFLYILNPFIILELTGNLHFEGVMLCFLSAAIYFLIKERNTISAVFFSLAVSVKLIPLLFLPLLFKKLQFKKSVIYYTIILGVNILYFSPFLSQELIDNFMSSIHLYFQNFEFNASIYYIIRAIGFEVKGYNIIQTVGKFTPIIIICFVAIVTFVRKNNVPQVLISSMLFSICFYYALSSIVHPWYVAVPLFLSVFTRYRFPLVWSFFIILSYAAYQTASYQENLTLVAIEYIIVYGVFFYEVVLGKTLRLIKVLKK